MPAEHVPITLLNGGAADAFSARCKALLAKADLTPDDFGSYSHVQSRINAATARVDAAKAGGPPASAHDQFLAGCTPGHLQQDGLFRKEGSRNDPCDVHVDGYDTRLAPTMPSRGDGDTRGTDEWRMGEHERDSIRNRGMNTGSRYPRDDMNADADDRLKHIPQLNQRDTSAVQGGSGPQGANGTNTGDASQPGGLGGGSGNSSGVAPGSLDGETAAECINAFRKAAEKAMKQQCIDEKPANEALVQRDAAAELAAAQTRLSNADAALDQARRDNAANYQVFTAAGCSMRNVPADQRREVGQAVGRVHAAENERTAAQADVTRATELPAQQASARCRVNQANALQRVPGTTLREDGVVPGGWDIGYSLP